MKSEEGGREAAGCLFKVSFNSSCEMNTVWIVSSANYVSVILHEQQLDYVAISTNTN